MQNKEAEMSFSRRELGEGVWADSKSHADLRRKQLNLIMPLIHERHIVLDAGCGPGTYGIMLALQGIEVIGIDISAESLKLAKERAKKEKSNFSVVVGDLENMPFKKDIFDFCLCAYTLHHFPEIVSSVGEFFRVSKTNSRIAFLEPNGSNPFMKLSGVFEGLMRDFLFSLGLDTPNEMLHGIEYYTLALASQGYVCVKVTSHCFEGLPPLPPVKTNRGILPFMSLFVVHFGVRLRYSFFKLSRIFPDPVGGANIMIFGTKNIVKNRKLT